MQKKAKILIPIFSIRIFDTKSSLSCCSMPETVAPIKTESNTLPRSTIMKVTVCIGSSCHIKGSRHVVAKLQELISANGLDDAVELGGTFCLGKCQQGVCVNVDDEFHSVSPDTVEEFFNTAIKAKV